MIFTPFRWTMRKLYAFISYNRKVIIPAPAGPAHTLQPSFKPHYRIAYLVFSWLITSVVLSAYSKLLTETPTIAGPYREYLIGAAQIIFQGIIIGVIAPAKRWEYLGNMMTIFLTGSLLLLPILALKTHITPNIATAYLMLIVAFMLFEHIRRTKLLSLNYTLTITWILYWLLILAP
jgi:hypothetical protein